MAYVETWDETTPDGATHHGYDVDDISKETKRAIRERMEGDTNLHGLVTNFGTACEPKSGMARLFNDLDANKGSAPLQDGRMFIATDTHKVYSLLTGGIQEIAYLDRDGARAMAGDLDLGGNKLTNPGDGTVIWGGYQFSTESLRYCIAANSHLTNYLMVAIPVPYKCIAKTLRVKMSEAVDAGDQVDVDVQKDGVDTALDCSITEGNDSCLNTDDEISYNAGQLINFKIAITGGPISAGINASCELERDV